jgi:uncharacterized membrane protein YeaQ/YmgE (transglycosylase-associated protein family)
MEWFAWSMVGAVSGWLASMVMRTNRQHGLLLDIVVGIIGAVAGGFLFNIAGITGTTGLNVWSVFVAFVGAVVLLDSIRMFSGMRSFYA